MNFFKLISVFILLISYHSCFGQTLIHTQEFAASSPSGWTTIDNGGSSSWVLNNTSPPCSGTYQARLGYSSGNDDWIISEGFTFTAGKLYYVRMSRKAVDQFDVYVGTAQTSANMLGGTNILTEN